MEILFVLIALGVAAYYFFKKSAPKRGSAPQSVEVRAHAVATKINRDWVRKFVLFFVAEELSMAFGSMPESIKGILTGQIDSPLQQRLLVSMQFYLSYANKRDREPGDYEAVLVDARNFLMSEVRAIRTPATIEEYIRRTHQNDTGMTITDEEFSLSHSQYLDAMSSSKETREKIDVVILKDRVESLFESAHQKPIREYMVEVNDHYERSIYTG